MMDLRGLAVTIVVVACGAPDPGAHAVVEPISAAKDQVPVKEVPVACIPTPDVASVTHAGADGNRVLYCVGGDASCFALDLATGKLERLKAPPATTPVGNGARVETTDPELKVCTGSDCKALTPKIMPGANPIRAATNAAGTAFVLLLGDAEGGKGYAEIWDVAKAKKTATFRYARGDYKCGEVAMLGDTIYVNATNCSGPTARAGLFSLKGAKIANVGKGEFGTYGNALVQLTTSTWAFLEENGNRIAIQDVAKGKILKTIDVSALWRKDGSPAKEKDKEPAMGNPGESAIVRVDDLRLAVIAGAPHNGSVAEIDTDAGTARVIRAPLCP